MAFPVLRSSRMTPQTSNSTSWTILFPYEAGDIRDGGASYYESGDLILVNIGRDGNSGSGSISAPSGYTKLFESTDGASVTGVTFAKIATASEGNITFAPGASEQGVARVLVFKNWYGSGHTNGTGVAISATPNTGSDANPNPPNLSPGWGALDIHWRAAYASDAAVTFVSAPANYTDNPNGDISTGGAGAGFAAAGRLLNAASEDPGTFSMSGSDGWLAWTIAIRPNAISTVPGSFTANSTFKKTTQNSFTANSTFKKTTQSSFSADALFALTTIDSVTSDATLFGTIPGSASADATFFGTLEDSFTADADFVFIGSGSVFADSTFLSTTELGIPADSIVLAPASASFTADAFIEWYITADAYISGGTATWVSPPDTSGISVTPVLVFNSPNLGKDLHFHIQLDKVNTFDGGDLRDIKTNFDQTGWEYDSTGAGGWTAFPATGMPAAYGGNEARYTVQVPLSSGTWYRRVRAG